MNRQRYARERYQVKVRIELIHLLLPVDFADPVFGLREGAGRINALASPSGGRTLFFE